MSEASALEANTLSVGRDATLTLGADSLIVLDDALPRPRTARNCCGVVAPDGSGRTQTIPLFNVLSAVVSNSTLIIKYAHAVKPTRLVPRTLKYQLPSTEESAAEAFVARLQARAYGRAKPEKRLHVLVNPHSGQGKALKLWHAEIDPLLMAAGCAVALTVTTGVGDGIATARKLDLEAFDAIVCCSGDGIAHEVFNGLGQRKDAKAALATMAVAHIPCGTGNALAINLFGTESPSVATLNVIKGIPMPMDLISHTQGTQHTLSFLCTALGIIAECDLGTENMRWMGDTRFTVGFLQRILKKTTYPCDIAVKVVSEDKAQIRHAYRKEVEAGKAGAEQRNRYGDKADNCIGDVWPPLQYGRVGDDLPAGWEMVPYDKLGNFFCGNMPMMFWKGHFFPAALPNDGCMDLICVDGDLNPITLTKQLLEIDTPKIFDNPTVWYRKISAYRVVPKYKDGYIGVDGERVPFAPFQAEVHRGLGTVLSKTGHTYIAPGPL